MDIVFHTRRRHAAPTAADAALRFRRPMGLAKSDFEPRSKTARTAPAVRPPAEQAQIEAQKVGCMVVHPAKDSPDPRLVNAIGADFCLKYRVLPWRNVAGRVTILTTSSEYFFRSRDALEQKFGPVHLAIVSTTDMDSALSRLCHKPLMESAEQRTPDVESCRYWDAKAAMRWYISIAAALVLCCILSLSMTFTVLCIWAIFTLILNTILKVVAAYFHIYPKAEKQVPADPEPAQLPVITILLPLFKERDIAGALINRVSRLNYPTERLDVCLVLEADDSTTQRALDEAELPPWIRAIRVPLGTLQTKPRAMNYALNFAKGSIIGVYDAEDAPDPDQLNIVAQRFAQRSRKVACLQGRLDFYNAHSNWLARCFTVEYATWFRVILPGLERLNFPIPLGGTTLFFRRDILEELGGWDAHNVTEDADLGVRLYRHGYRTEIIDTATQEEANARVWPWIKQRSRWLKGYVITYGVHMRDPLKLWRELGPWQFFGVQLLFLGSISQFLLAPVLWSFWLLMFGLPHPLSGLLGPVLVIPLAATFLLAEVIGISVSALAVATAQKRELIKWVPTLHFYYPLAVVAGYKGVIELATKPFYWDKTSHGIFEPTTAELSPPPPPPPHQAAGG